jgi:hypothetical protein
LIPGSSPGTKGPAMAIDEGEGGEPRSGACRELLALLIKPL